MATVEQMLAALDEDTAREARTRIAVGDPLAANLHNFLESVREYETGLTDDGRTVVDVSVDARVAELNGWIGKTTDGLDNRVWALSPAGEQALKASIDAIDREELAEMADVEAEDRRLARQSFGYGAAFGGLLVAFVAAVVWVLATL